MKFRRPVCSRWLNAGVFAALTSGITLTGCGAKPTESPVSNTSSEAKSSETSTGESANEVVNYNVPFTEAVTEDLREDQLLPLDRTIAGKATAPLREAVEKMWPSIVLADKAGKPISYVVNIETAEGAVEITLNPASAPNHVRNFLSLVKLGYYDGLKFDRVIHQEAVREDGQKFRVDMLKAGCPAGTGDPGIGHIGYHIKPEFSQKIKHEEGTVGFLRDVEAGSAGVRFYVSLGTAPALDGNFSLIGKVTQGMDALKRIAAGKLLPPEIDPTREFPEKPVAMTKLRVNPDPTSPNGDISTSKSLK